MSPTKLHHFINQGFELKGVIHVGTNIGQEMPEYIGMGLNIVGFEPLPEAREVFVNNYPNYTCLPVGLGAKSEKRILQVTATADGQSSTVYDPNVTEGYPLTEIIKDRIEIHIDRFDELAFNNIIDVSLYDTVVIDVQGMEYETIIGFGVYLKYFKYYVIECSESPIYKGGEPAQKVVDYMVANGFTQDTPIVAIEDIMFVRKDIKPTSDLTFRGIP